jgi:hypothetical protein
MSEELAIASMMLCKAPRSVNDRLMLSCCDAVWSPIEILPPELEPSFTDELGNSGVKYGGFLQIVDFNALRLLADRELYACFRCIGPEFLQHVQVNPPSRLYEKFFGDLVQVGWDIATGNGWLSASSHGCFPVDPFSGREIDQNAHMVNRFGLFSAFGDCLAYCQQNDSAIPEHAPWFPVAIRIDKDSYTRLVERLEAKR